MQLNPINFGKRTQHNIWLIAARHGVQLLYSDFSNVSRLASLELERVVNLCAEVRLKLAQCGAPSQKRTIVQYHGLRSVRQY